ncbi:MAG TPA: rhodanese-like domain-containing protein [Acidimicrobiia bacterium]|nr:rhodanese-like domain-containing protein [Acidimicrobiia bacterium]
MKRIWNVLAAVSTLLIIGLSGCTSAGTLDQQIAGVSPAQAAGIVEENSGNEDFVILDIRTPEEYAAGKIEGAINVDFYAGDFRRQLDALDKDTHYLVYCSSGNRSGQALPIFEDLGFARVDNLATGISGWFDQKYPVVP